MEYKRPPPSPPKLQPRIIIHGGAGNITPATLTPDRYSAFRSALLTIVSTTQTYMTTPLPYSDPGPGTRLPSALAVATHAVTQLEDNPLFNAARGAVFTRDGTHELEASVMVSRGRAKRGVGVSGLQHVRNPVLLAREILLRGDVDLTPLPRRWGGGGLEEYTEDTEERGGRYGRAEEGGGGGGLGETGTGTGTGTGSGEIKGAPEDGAVPRGGGGFDVPSAQGHTHLHGAPAEQLAAQYRLPLVDPGYFFTWRRWDEHVRGLVRERAGAGVSGWSSAEFLPQGTVGAVAVDEEGVVCCATSTGGLTNKLSGRVGDTPTVGAGFWAEEWAEDVQADGPAVELAGALRGLLAECLPTPWMYTPVHRSRGDGLTATRSVAVSGTGNGDSFLRTTAARTVGAIARFGANSSAVALSKVTGPGGELQRSAGDRWGKTGEGEGGMIGIECVVVRDVAGNVVEARSELLQDYNCAGMFRAWVDERGIAFARVFREDQEVPPAYVGEEKPEDPRGWCAEKTSLVV